MSYQRITGCLMANSHPGSYCGQDAYNDMLIVDSCNTGSTYKPLESMVGGVHPQR